MRENTAREEYSATRIIVCVRWLAAFDANVQCASGHQVSHSLPSLHRRDVSVVEWIRNLQSCCTACRSTTPSLNLLLPAATLPCSAASVSAAAAQSEAEHSSSNTSVMHPQAA